MVRNTLLHNAFSANLSAGLIPWASAWFSSSFCTLLDQLYLSNTHKKKKLKLTFIMQLDGVDTRLLAEHSEIYILFPKTKRRERRSINIHKNIHQHMCKQQSYFQWRNSPKVEADHSSRPQNWSLLTIDFGDLTKSGWRHYLVSCIYEENFFFREN